MATDLTVSVADSPGGLATVGEALGAAGADREALRPAHRAPSGRCAHGAAHLPRLGAEHPPAGRARRSSAAGPAHLGGPGARYRGEHEPASRIREGLGESPRAAAGARAHHLDLGPRSRPGSDRGEPTRGRLDRGADRLQHDGGPRAARAFDRDVPDMEVRGSILPVRGVRFA